MRPVALLVSAAALVLASPNLSAQAKPSFAGKWTMIVDTTAQASSPAPGRRGGRGERGSGRGGLGNDITIAQDARTLTITRTTRGGENTRVFNLDGSPSKNTMTGGRGGAAIDQLSNANWQGSNLLVSTKSTFNGNPVQMSMTLSLDAAGNLVVQSTGSGRGGGTQITTKTTYRKSP